jgi:hypothetical protein
MLTNRNKPRQASRVLGPPDAIPEMDVEECRQLFKEHLEIFSEYVEGSSYLYKFIGKPYNCFVQDCPSRIIPTHHRGTKFSPLCLKCLLDKFEISEQEFKDAYNTFYSSGIAPPEPPPQSTTRPN